MATTTLTNATISETYVSLLHSNGEILPDTGQVVIYDGCGNESSIKIGRCSDNAGLTVCGPISASGALDGDWSTLIDLIYPVGSIFFSADNVNPGVRFTGTTWTRISQGRFIAGVGTGTDKNNVTHTVAAGQESGTGEYEVEITEPNLPSGGSGFANVYLDHVPGATPRGTQAYSRLQAAVGAGEAALYSEFSHENSGHTSKRNKYASAGFAELSLNGQNVPHNNIPPYFGLYVWRRTA